MVLKICCGGIDMEIVCTIGPATNSPSMVRMLWCAGVTVFRLNLSHTQTIEEINDFVKMIKFETGEKTCLDTHGMKFCPRFPSHGIIETTCLETPKDHQTYLDLRENDVNKPQNFTKFDIESLKHAKNWGIDQVAVSFAQSADAINEARTLSNVKFIIAKIEDNRGVSNQTEIIAASDAILIDRGDLSKSFPPEDIPRICREIILTCKGMKTPVWIATNLLESMVGSPQPTQAEVNDIATLIMLGVDGLVLAAETAIGNYPIECVQFVRKMIERYEKK